MYIYIYIHVRNYNKHTHTHTYIYIYIYMWKSCAGQIRAPNLGVRHLFGFRPGGRPNFSFNEFERRISASGTFSASGWGADRISASTNSSAEFRRHAHFRASGWGPTEFQLQRIRAPNFGVRHIFGFRLGADRISASTNSSAEFRRQAHFRLQAGVRANFRFNDFERRISASGTFSASGWGPTEFQLQRIRAPNFGVRHLFG